ncbi:MAG: hypothetical protein IPI66_07170 [Chitinophagaceae bacterium]|nr:hypothetical protein [Chitinophagaceae bacterium]
MMTHAMTGYALQEYLIVIDIPEALRHKIEKAREELMTNYPVRQPKVGLVEVLGRAAGGTKDHRPPIAHHPVATALPGRIQRFRRLSHALHLYPGSHT